jgi:superfamily II DNA/RNA helicase
MRRFFFASSLFPMPARGLSFSRYRGPIPAAPVAREKTTGDAQGPQSYAPAPSSTKLYDDIDSILQPLVKRKFPEDESPSSSSISEDGSALPSDRKTADCWIFKTKVVDKFGMDAHVEAIEKFEDLANVLPEQLEKHFLTYRRRFGLKVPTSVQKVTIPLVLQGRDVLCIAPTGSGKSVCYLVPTIAKTILDQKTAADSGNPLVVEQSDIESIVSAKMSRGEICKYCELDVSKAKVCPITGHLHKPPADLLPGAGVFDEENGKDDEHFGPAEPRIVILAPTSELVKQIHSVCMSFRCSLKVALLVRATTEADKQAQARLLKGSNIVISTPEPLIQALYKREVSFNKVQAIVFDEVDALLGVAYFDFVKIMLAKLPKHEKRPQRLLFGATLPPSMHEMIRDVMLLPSHRFVTGDTLDNQRIGTRNSNITHLVFMVSRAEKIDKLQWLYDTQRITANQRTIIFCNSRHNVDYVTRQLRARIGEPHQVRFVTMDSKMNAEDRDRAKKLFQSGVCTAMVCTDLMSRGIDFHGVVYVVHYEMPLDFEVFIHRSGRCGRHGLPGFCYSLYTPEDVRLAKPLVAFLRQTRQLVPAKLVEYSNSSFAEIFQNSLLHHPTKSFKRRNPEVNTPAHGRGIAKYPDFKHLLKSREGSPV